MNMFALSFTVMLGLILAELAWLKFSRQQPIPWKDVVFNLNSGHILMWVFRSAEILAFGWVLKYMGLHWVENWQPLWQWIFAFIGWDFCFYWMHRMHHKIPALWAVHVVHHQGEHFNLSLGVRNSWYSSLTNFPFVIILAVLGVPLETFLLVSSLHYAVQFYNHNALIGKSGWLDKIMVTPANHRVHHGIASIYRNKNFGGTLLLWDKLFSTWQNEDANVPLQYGVPGSVHSNNPLWANNKRLQSILARWLPSLQNRKNHAMPAEYIGSGGILLFGFVIYYVNLEGSHILLEKICLFASVFIGTIIMGAVSDGKRWGVVAWIVLSVGIAGIFIGCFQWRGPVGLILIFILLGHSLVGLLSFTKVIYGLSLKETRCGLCPRLGYIFLRMKYRKNNVNIEN